MRAYTHMFILAKWALQRAPFRTSVVNIARQGHRLLESGARGCFFLMPRRLRVLSIALAAVDLTGEDGCACPRACHGHLFILEAIAVPVLQKVRLRLRGWERSPRASH